MKIAKKYIHQSGKHVGKLNQKLLQIPGKFKQSDPHPYVKNIVFHSYRENKKQRWITADNLTKLRKKKKKSYYKASELPKKLNKN